MNDVIIQPEPRRDVTPFELLDRAISSGVPIETLRELMALQREHQATVARAAFDEAMAAARGKFKPIKRNKRVKYDAKQAGSASTDYGYETLSAVAEMVDPILAKHGLTYTFDATSEIGAPISVTCTIAHRLGHRQSLTLWAGRDESGKKNPHQAIGSAIVYLQRYSLKAILGLAVAPDTDGRTQEEEPQFITDVQLDELTALVEDVGADLPKLLEFLKISSLADIYADKFDAAKRVIESKRKAKK